MRLETERLMLRMPRLEDATAFTALYTDPVAMAFIGGVHPDAAADPEYPIRVWLERWERNGLGPLVVERPEDGTVLGRTGLLVWDVRTWTHTTFAQAGDHAQPELGWAFIREHWGHGYATEAALAVREWVYKKHSISRLISLIAPDNERSQRLARRLGAMPGETVNLFDGGPHVVWTHP
jgi:RimJ/RimL family protein N-acetyltransferase